MLRVGDFFLKQGKLLVLFAFIICCVLCCSQKASHAETVKWGPYIVVSKQTSFSTDTDRTWKIWIKSNTGATLREIHGFKSANIKILKSAAKGNSLLTLELGDGGNDGLNLVYIYSYSDFTGIKNLVATYGSLDELHFKDLRHHALPELVVNDACLNQFDHFSRSALGDVIRVYEWNGDTYQDKTLQYAEVTTSNLNLLRSKFLRSLPTAEDYVRGPFVDGQDDSMASSHEDVMAATVYYWANAIVDGKSTEAEQLFRRTASPRLQAWLRTKRRLVIEALSTGHKNIRTDDSKLVGT